METCNTFWKLEATWLDNDGTTHTTVTYTSFEIDDEVAESLVDIHAKAVGIEMEELESTTITPPLLNTMAPDNTIAPVQ